MSTAKLVKNFILISFLLLFVELLKVKGVWAESSEEESDAPAGRIVYDQRQTGKYNIHVVIKDVAIIEMDQNEIADQNYSDEEYYYDEDDLTVKPLIMKNTTTTLKPINNNANSTTIKPSNLTTQTIPETSNSNQTTTMTEPSEQPIITTTINTPSTTQEEIQSYELNSYSSSYPPAIDIKSRSKVEPIYAIDEPILKTRDYFQDSNYGLPTSSAQSRRGSYSVNNGVGKNLKNSRIYKVKVHRSQIVPQMERCRANQYRDARGNCRRKRDSSGSILKRLFKMLITLPFRQNDKKEIDDYGK